jgi:hypothetical protein
MSRFTKHCLTMLKCQLLTGIRIRGPSRFSFSHAPLELCFSTTKTTSSSRHTMSGEAFAAYSLWLNFSPMNCGQEPHPRKDLGHGGR